MSPLTHDALKWSLIAVFLAALGTCARVNSRMTRRARESGYSWFNPMTFLLVFSGAEFPIFLAALLVGVVAVMGLKMLR
jgi:hypothetical protein